MHVTTKFIAHGADLDMHLKHFQQTFTSGVMTLGD